MLSLPPKVARLVLHPISDCPDKQLQRCPNEPETEWMTETNSQYVQRELFAVITKGTASAVVSSCKDHGIRIVMHIVNALF